MKKIITILLVSVLLVACKAEEKQSNRDGYLISGDAPGVYNGIRVYLEAPGERGKSINIDTAIVMNEKFTFDGKVANPQLLNLIVNSVKGKIPIILENKDIAIQIDKDNLINSKISGTKANDDLNAYSSKLSSLVTQIKALRNKIDATTDNQEKSKLSLEYNNLNKQYVNLPVTYIEENKGSLYALVLLDNLQKARNADLDNVASLYNTLDESIKNTSLGIKISTNIEKLKKQKELTRATEIGKKAPVFTAPTPEGEQLSLKDAMGKVTIIDFWASWCGPCRRENPNVVKIYNKYHSKGLEIIGVSLDGTTRQKNPKDAWIKAIAKDKLTWNHVSNLNYFNDQVAKAYNIRSIPATFILDENGTIIAKNLRGAELEAKIAELLN
ncbi:hypothetical protein A9Q86_15745 [Flavobacteriales bacterium 33_180_T64]|nr:hypothetical protein A9Q86_15745 [Flavobacteriales bacterium 33_180_T64]